MILPLVAMLVQTAQSPATSPGPQERAVRVWLDSSHPLTRGTAVRVYVQVGEGGHLVVLHRSTDGHIDVLFPAKPTEEPSVGVGTYEIRGPGNRAALVIAEPDGTGMILAALSSDAVQFDEFVRDVSWNPAALVPAWNGADAEGALSDIVQRMLGDGTFNYDVVTYTVAPAAYAAQDTSYAPQDTTANYAAYPACPGCTFIGYQVIVEGPGFFCEGFFAPCFGGRRFHRDEQGCGSLSPCGPQPTAALALALKPASVARISPAGSGAGGAGAAGAAGAGAGGRLAPPTPLPAPPRLPGATPRATPGTRPRAPQGTSPRAPSERAIPLVPGRALASAPRAARVIVSSSTQRAPGVAEVQRGAQPVPQSTPPLSAAPRRHVRFTLVSAPRSEGIQGTLSSAEPQAVRGRAPLASSPAAVARAAVALPRAAVGAARAPTAGRSAPQATGALAEPVARAPAPAAGPLLGQAYHAMSGIAPRGWAGRGGAALGRSRR